MQDVCEAEEGEGDTIGHSEWLWLHFAITVPLKFDRRPGIVTQLRTMCTAFSAVFASSKSCAPRGYSGSASSLLIDDNRSIKQMWFFPMLETLILDNNDITGLHNFPKLPSLTTLWLNKNKVRAMATLSNAFALFGANI